jgi:hypothetical protein
MIESRSVLVSCFSTALNGDSSINALTFSMAVCVHGYGFPHLTGRGRTPLVRMAQQITEIATILMYRRSSD